MDAIKIYCGNHLYIYVVCLCVCVCVWSHFSHVQLSVTTWIVACQASLSMGFPRQQYWSGLPFPSPKDLPNPGIKPVSLASPPSAGRFLPLVPIYIYTYIYIYIFTTTTIYIHTHTHQVIILYTYNYVNYISILKWEKTHMVWLHSYEI